MIKINNTKIQYMMLHRIKMTGCSARDNYYLHKSYEFLIITVILKKITEYNKRVIIIWIWKKISSFL